MKNINDDIATVLFTAEEIEQRISVLSEDIRRDFGDKNPMFISVLRGSFIFMADLMRKVNIPCTMEFISASTYASKTTTDGTVTLKKDFDVDIKGRHVVIVEDIFDTGVTLDFIKKLMLKKDPASVSLCVLLDKQERRDKGITLTPDYTGFVIQDGFVVGYGLDYDDKYRSLPYIGLLKPECINS